MTKKITTACLVDDMPEHEYHADPVEGGSLSSTMARKILDTPAHLAEYLQGPPEYKNAYDMGSAVHALVLGTGWPIRVCEFDDWRKKEAREQRESARAEGEIPLLPHEHEHAKRIAQAVKDHPIAGPLFQNGRPEVSAFAPHPNAPIWLRARMDWVTPDHILVDLKTARTADPRRWSRTVYEYGYDVQRALYCLAYRQATGIAPRGFIHVAVENEAPFAISVNQLDPEFVRIGDDRLDRAVRRYVHAIETNQWPSYPPVIHQTAPEAWMAYAEDDAQEKETTP